MFNQHHRPGKDYSGQRRPRLQISTRHREIEWQNPGKLQLLPEIRIQKTSRHRRPKSQNRRNKFRRQKLILTGHLTGHLYDGALVGLTDVMPNRGNCLTRIGMITHIHRGLNVKDRLVQFQSAVTHITGHLTGHFKGEK